MTAEMWDVFIGGLGVCTGTGTRDGGMTHTEPVRIERNEALCGWWCPVCRSLVVSDERIARSPR